MNAVRLAVSAALVLAAAGTSGCVSRTWEDKYAVREAAPPVGTHHRRTYKYGDYIPPAVNPRVKIEGEGLRMLIDQLRTAGGG